MVAASAPDRNSRRRQDSAGRTSSSERAVNNGSGRLPRRRTGCCVFHLALKSCFNFQIAPLICLGTLSEGRALKLGGNNGTSPFLPSPAFTSIHLIATGVSCFLGAGLLSFLIYVYCQRVHKPSQESAIIHPTTPNHLNYKGNTTPKNEKYTPMEFKVRDASCPFFLLGSYKGNQGGNRRFCLHARTVLRSLA